eukprot:TRINITY_DN11010_c0_g1_i3.p1 TRINITY_DN11010_c0_g1~~TRINITY_DN11010_c0_g1_i3.p1  ORF type:complete len:858 (-),score=132.17 TRINITY_DN11010_c0_g1_i3:291-2864(-)
MDESHSSSHSNSERDSCSSNGKNVLYVPSEDEPNGDDVGQTDGEIHRDEVESRLFPANISRIQTPETCVVGSDGVQPKRERGAINNLKEESKARLTSSPLKTNQVARARTSAQANIQMDKMVTAKSSTSPSKKTQLKCPIRNMLYPRESPVRQRFKPEVNQRGAYLQPISEERDHTGKGKELRLPSDMPPRRSVHPSSSRRISIETAPHGAVGSLLNDAHKKLPDGNVLSEHRSNDAQSEVRLAPRESRRKSSTFEDLDDGDTQMVTRLNERSHWKSTKVSSDENQRTSLKKASKPVAAYPESNIIRMSKEREETSTDSESESDMELSSSCDNIKEQYDVSAFVDMHDMPDLQKMIPSESQPPLSRAGISLASNVETTKDSLIVSIAKPLETKPHNTCQEVQHVANFSSGKTETESLPIPPRSDVMILDDPTITTVTNELKKHNDKFTIQNGRTPYLEIARGYSDKDGDSYLHPIVNSGTLEREKAERLDGDLQDGICKIQRLSDTLMSSLLERPSFVVQSTQEGSDTQKLRGDVIERKTDNSEQSIGRVLHPNDRVERGLHDNHGNSAAFIKQSEFGFSQEKGVELSYSLLDDNQSPAVSVNAPRLDSMPHFNLSKTLCETESSRRVKNPIKPTSASDSNLIDVSAPCPGSARRESSSLLRTDLPYAGSSSPTDAKEQRAVSEAMEEAFGKTQDKGTIQSKEKSAATVAPEFDDVIHVIRHSTFRIAAEKPRNSTSGDMSPPNMEVNIEEEINYLRPLAKIPDNVSAQKAPYKEEECHKKKSGTIPYRQRADALEGLLELSAQLLDQKRLDELAVVLRPFGKDMNSPREAVIWMAQNLRVLKDGERRDCFNAKADE